MIGVSSGLVSMSRVAATGTSGAGVQELTALEMIRRVSGATFFSAMNSSNSPPALQVHHFEDPDGLTERLRAEDL